MTRYIEQLNECTDPAMGDWLWLVDTSANATDKDRKVSAGKFLLANVANAAKTIFGPGTTIAIVSGEITVVGSYHLIDTEGGAATDDLVTINGGQAGQIVILRTAISTRDVVLKHATGNVLLGGSDLTLFATANMVVLIHNGTNWVKIASV